MDAASLLSEVLKMSKGLYKNLGYDEPTVEKITITVTDRLDCEWFRKANGIKNEDVHLIEKN